MMKLVENSRGQGCSETQGGGYEVGGGDEEGEESAVDGLTAGPRLGEGGQLPRPPVGDVLHLAKHCCVIDIQNLSIHVLLFFWVISVPKLQTLYYSN